MLIPNCCATVDFIHLSSIFSRHHDFSFPRVEYKTTNQIMQLTLETSCTILLSSRQLHCMELMQHSTTWYNHNNRFSCQKKIVEMVFLHISFSNQGVGDKNFTTLISSASLLFSEHRWTDEHPLNYIGWHRMHFLFRSFYQCCLCVQMLHCNSLFIWTLSPTIVY